MEYHEIYQNTYFEEHLRMAAFLESVLQEHFPDQNLAKGTCDETLMVTCYVKGCSYQSRLNKTVSYHKVLNEEKKD